jgi:hypothetical protein
MKRLTLPPLLVMALAEALVYRNLVATRKIALGPYWEPEAQRL